MSHARLQYTQPTIFNLADVTDDQIADRNLNNFTTAQRCKLVLVLNLALQAAKLSLFAPVVERRHQHDDDNSCQDSNAFYPAGLVLALIVSTCRRSRRAAAIINTCTRWFNFTGKMSAIATAHVNNHKCE